MKTLQPVAIPISSSPERIVGETFAHSFRKGHTDPPAFKMAQMTADEASMIPEERLRPWVNHAELGVEHEKEVRPGVVGRRRWSSMPALCPPCAANGRLLCE